MSLSNAFLAHERKKAELVNALFLCDRYLSELKMYIMVPDDSFKKDTFLALSTTAIKLEQMASFLVSHYAQMEKIVPAPLAPPLRGSSAGRVKIVESYMFQKVGK